MRRKKKKKERKKKTERKRERSGLADVYLNMALPNILLACTLSCLYNVSFGPMPWLVHLISENHWTDGSPIPNSQENIFSRHSGNIKGYNCVFSNISVCKCLVFCIRRNFCTGGKSKSLHHRKGLRCNLLGSLLYVTTRILT